MKITFRGSGGADPRFEQAAIPTELNGVREINETLMPDGARRTYFLFADEQSFEHAKAVTKWPTVHGLMLRMDMEYACIDVGGKFYNTYQVSRR